MAAPNMNASGDRCLNLGRNTCTHIHTHMHTNAFIHTNEVFVSMHGEVWKQAGAAFSVYVFALNWCVYY